MECSASWPRCTDKEWICHPCAQSGVAGAWGHGLFRIHPNGMSKHKRYPGFWLEKAANGWDGSMWRNRAVALTDQGAGCEACAEKRVWKKKMPPTGYPVSVVHANRGMEML